MSKDAADWGQGYVVDVEYIHSYLAGLAPLNLALAAAQCGVRPPDVDGAFAYLDVGCGNGFTPALVAAAHPQAQVWGNDFNPAHIRRAQATAEAAGLSNTRFLEASFADLLDRDLPPFDMVVVHGIWSWISDENRGHVADLLGRCLKPGGLAMVSYNCHPGWAPLLPLRRLLSEAGGQEGRTTERVARALRTARALCDAGADYFRDNPPATAMLEQLEQADPRYLAHEYLNGNWSLFHARDVHAAMASAGLAYIGQGRLFENRDDLWLTAEQQALLAGREAAEADALRDLILNRRFRRDLFVRGVPERDGAAAWLEQRRFVLAKPRSACLTDLDTRAGPIPMPVLAGPALDRLAQGPATAADLATALGAPLAEATAVLGLLAALGQVQPVVSPAGAAARRAGTERFNAAALAGVRMGDPAPALASPVTGAGVQLGTAEQLLLDACRMGVPAEVLSFGDEGAADRFRADTLPLLERLGVL